MKTKNFFNIIFGTLIVACYQSQAIADFIVKRDYDFATLLPQTGKVTIRKPIQDLPAQSLFESCPPQSYLQDFAESTHFLVMVCRDRRNEFQKYWIQKNKKTGSILRLTAQDKPQSEPSLWKNGVYSVSLYIDGRSPELTNAYLESYNLKTQQGRAEALLYHYSEFYGSR
ncbi:MAG: hypothetical protein DCF19_05965 [Pseudanabaena frigida]|uniref:Uncharacterized protein n=1 Tax=Pseudanabaena frigida TaxID=945775 RepID=A0A2W4WG98_9CYAN|nr:MAG: hypothetical protein DCF19_05965 [Pseudanabaena frigida]